jgi:SAM-dependent methyltransferase
VQGIDEPKMTMTNASIEEQGRHLQAVDAGLDGLRMAIDGVKSQSRASAAIGEDQPAPHARVPLRAQEMMDWLRADMSGRYFGVEAMSYVALEPSAGFEAPGRAPLSIGNAIGPALSGPLPEVARKDAYRLEELMGFHDEAFVRNAYICLVRREPTPEENQRWLRALQVGEASRQEVLGAVRYSQEGRDAGVQVGGLRLVMLVRRLRRVPGLWRLIGIVQYVIQLPVIVRNLEALTARVHRQAWNLDANVAGVLQDLREVGRRLEEDGQAVSRHLDHVAGRLDALRKSEQAMRTWIGAFGENLVTVHKQAAELHRLVALQAPKEDVLAISQQALGSLAAMRASIGVLEREKATVESLEQESFQASVRAESLHAALALLDERKATTEWVEESVRHVSDQLTTLSRRELALDTQVRKLVEDFGSRGFARTASETLDAFYVDFENKFRGSREDIKSRVATYVPTVEAAVRASAGAVVVDVGCGRGEWLELLQEKGIAARGVDANAAMVAECRARKLKVRKADAVAYLRDAKPASMGAVTGFHIIEHLSLSELLGLFEETFRVLKAGGVAIFETPNPENLRVGACNFWYDPTHVKPLPPELVKHMAVAHGFDRVEILRLHPVADWEHLPDGGDQEARARVNSVLYGAQDYAVVAHKA